MMRLKPLGKLTRIEIVGTLPVPMDAASILEKGLRGPRSSVAHTSKCLQLGYKTSTGDLLTAVGTTMRLFGEERFPTSGAFLYVIFSVYASAVYVGSTNNLMRRLSTHRGGLKTESHRNVNLMKLFRDLGGDDIEVLFLDFGHLPEERLRAIEQEVLDAAHAVTHLQVLNRSVDTVVFGKGLQRDESFRVGVSLRKRKGVRCAGVSYVSLTAAAIALGLVKSQVYNRIKSNDPQFSDWIYET